MNANNNDDRILIWDLPTRVFHWTLVIALSAAWITAEDDRYLFHHVFAGYLFFGLLIFRLVWGFIGTRYSQFRSFAYNWSSVYEYLKGLLSGDASRHLGHNPAGSWAIFIMLVLGVLISLTGLLVLGGEEGHGPLKGLVSFDVGNAAKELHEGLAEFILVVIFVHVCGVIVESLWHKENLIWAMITGFKPSNLKEQGVRKFALLGVVMISVIFIATTLYFKDYVTQTENEPFLAFKRDPLPDNPNWREACGECHTAFHPTLLPARSWNRMMDEQSEHFGEDLGLEAEAVQEIQNFLVANAAESGITEPAHKVNKSIPKDQAPLRITETAYWKKKHKDIEDKYWKSKKVGSKAACEACHRDAKQGWFEDSNMKLPNLQ